MKPRDEGNSTQAESPAGAPPSFGGSTAPQPAATSAEPDAADAADAAAAAAAGASATPPAAAQSSAPASQQQAATPQPLAALHQQAGPQQADPGWYPSTPAGYSPSAGPYAAVGPYAGPGGKSGGSKITLAGRGKLLNILMYGVAPLVLAGVVAIVFVLNSPGKSKAAADTGFKAGAAPSSGQQQPQGSGSSAGSTPGAASSPSPGKKTNTGKRSSMPLNNLPSSSQSSAPGQNQGSSPKHSQKSKKKSSRSSPAPSGPVTPANLGQPNFAGYCGSIGEGTAEATANNAYGWACSAQAGVRLQVDSACAYTFRVKTSQVINVTTNFYSTTSWQCWRTNGMLGLLNITSYCSSAGLGAVKLNADNAYGWTCGGAGVNTDAGCQAEYNSSDAFSRFEVWSDPNSWQCWD